MFETKGKQYCTSNETSYFLENFFCTLFTFWLKWYSPNIVRQTCRLVCALVFFLSLYSRRSFKLHIFFVDFHIVNAGVLVAEANNNEHFLWSVTQNGIYVHIYSVFVSDFIYFTPNSDYFAISLSLFVSTALRLRCLASMARFLFILSILFDIGF